MNRAKILNMFTMYVQCDNDDPVPDNAAEYVDASIDNVMERIKSPSVASDPRLDFLAASQANLNYRMQNDKDITQAITLYNNSLEICKTLLKA